MDLEVTEVDEIRFLVDNGRANSLQSQSWDTIALDARLELLCSWWSWENEGLRDGVLLAQSWARHHAQLQNAWNILNRRQWPHDSVRFTAPTTEMCPSPLESEVDDPNWTEFRQRFSKSLQNNGGFDLKLSQALAMALEEMATNVTDHSGPDPAHPAPGIVAYEVHPGWMRYAVADVGRGVLSSLQTQPKWKDLRDSRAALDEAVRRGATRRSSGFTGGGFREVEKSLADRNGHLRFRSGNGLLTLTGRGETREVISSPASPPRCGFQLSVTCRI